MLTPQFSNSKLVAVASSAEWFCFRSGGRCHSTTRGDNVVEKKKPKKLPPSIGEYTRLRKELDELQAALRLNRETIQSLQEENKKLATESKGLRDQLAAAAVPKAVTEVSTEKSKGMGLRL